MLFKVNSNRDNATARKVLYFNNKGDNMTESETQAAARLLKIWNKKNNWKNYY